jgi:hypothetical protein
VREPERGAAWIVEGLLTERERGLLGGGSMHCRHRGQVAGEPLDGQYADAMRRVHGSAGALTPTGGVTLAGTLPRMNSKLTRRGRSYPTRGSAQPPLHAQDWR